MERDGDFGVIDSGDNPEMVYQICKGLGLTNDPEERVYVIMLDNQLQVLGVSEVSHGSSATANVGIGGIFKRALLCNASNIIIAHNHPSGGLSASEQDKELTKSVIAAGELMEIPLLDHIIITEDSYMSMAEAGIGGFR